MGFIHEHAGWFIYPMILLGIVWFWRGGTEYQSSHEPFIQPLAPLGGGQTYGNIYLSHDTVGQKLDLPENPITTVRNFFRRLSGVKNPTEDTSTYSRVFLIDGEAGVKSSEPQQEYIRILANKDNTGTKTLSGLVLTSTAYGIKGTIPPAVNTFVLSSTTPKTVDVSLPSDGRAIITSGKSPVGSSFRVNMCTGYLGQSQTFTPELRVDCPSPTEELKKYGPSEVSCIAFVEKLPSCQTYSGSFPVELSSSCKKFVADHLSYNSCVAEHSTDADFYKNEWRIFFGSTEELWKNKSEVIHLYNPNGTVVDAISY